MKASANVGSRFEDYKLNDEESRKKIRQGIFAILSGVALSVIVISARAFSPFSNISESAYDIILIIIVVGIVGGGLASLSAGMGHIPFLKRSKKD